MNYETGRLQSISGTGWTEAEDKSPGGGYVGLKCITSELLRQLRVEGQTVNRCSG